MTCWRLRVRFVANGVVIFELSDGEGHDVSPVELFYNLQPPTPQSKLSTATATPYLNVLWVRTSFMPVTRVGVTLRGCV